LPVLGAPVLCHLDHFRPRFRTDCPGGFVYDCSARFSGLMAESTGGL
jgi:hypothetical protein